MDSHVSWNPDSTSQRFNTGADSRETCWVDATWPHNLRNADTHFSLWFPNGAHFHHSCQPDFHAWSEDGTDVSSCRVLMLFSSMNGFYSISGHVTATKSLFVHFFLGHLVQKRIYKCNKNRWKHTEAPSTPRTPQRTLIRPDWADD